MAGHNKWSKVKHKKAVTDAQKSKLFSKLAKLIATESKKCNGDPDCPGLRAAIEKARKANMPKDNIERAIKKGVSKDVQPDEEVIYEFYGPAGVAVIVYAITDNKNRTTPEIKHILTKNGYELATPGSATWAFKKEGSDYIPTTFTSISQEDAEKLEDILEKLQEHDDVQEIYTNAQRN